MNPGTPFFDVFSHTPQCGRATGWKLPPGCLSKRSKRIAIVTVLSSRGIEPVKTAYRSAAAAPVWQVASLAASGGAWATATAPPARAAVVRPMRAVGRIVLGSNTSYPLGLRVPRNVHLEAIQVR